MREKSHLLHIISSLEIGGAQEVLRTVCADTYSDHVHTIFYMTGSNAYTDGEDSLAFANSLNVTGIFGLIRAVLFLSRLLKATRAPVCVQGWLYQGNLLALLIKLVAPRTPVLFGIHNGSDRKGFTSVSGFLASRVCGLFSGMVKSTIFVSKSSLTSHVPYKNSVVIPNPIKPLKKDDSTLGSRADSLAPKVTLACVARFDPVKNIDFMLDVTQHLRAMGFPIRLLMAGEGMSAKNCELMMMIQTRGLEDQVELQGVVSDIASIYLRADYTILTSRCESFSNVLLESIACGTPFISSDVGIATDLVSPESAVIQGYDVADWAVRLQDILQIRKTLMTAQSVRKHYEQISAHYAPGRIARLYAECWANAMEQ